MIRKSVKSTLAIEAAPLAAPEKPIKPATTAKRPAQRLPIVKGPFYFSFHLADLSSTELGIS